MTKTKSLIVACAAIACSLRAGIAPASAQMRIAKCGGALVETADVFQSNGVVDVIDSVLMP